jgi:hypothetical protein
MQINSVIIQYFQGGEKPLYSLFQTILISLFITHNVYIE